MDDREQEAADKTIKAALTPKYNRVFFLGPYARRVSFASQQNRALNLVWALARTQVIKQGWHIAVIGAGLSGVTTAIALSMLDFRVTLVERGKFPLNRQRNSRHRYIHPSVSYWPEEACVPTTRFPYFDWISDECSRVMDALAMEWELLSKKCPRLKVVCEAEVAEIEEDNDGKVLLQFAKDTNDDLNFTKFNAAIVTSGFADEPVKGYSFLRTYWRDENLEDIVATTKAHFLVSGRGDGGLIDSLRIVHKDFRCGQLIVDVAQSLQRNNWSYLEKISHAEEAVTDPKTYETATKTGSKDLAKTYREAARRLPAETRRIMEQSLRQRKQDRNLVTIIALEEVPFSPSAAPIHKLMIAHAINKLIVQYKQAKALDFKEDEMKVLFAGRDKAEWISGRVVVRHGARPNFGELLKDEAAMIELIRRQVLLAANLDNRMWAGGSVPLYRWPPSKSDNGRYDAKLLEQREKQARKIMVRVDDPGARFSTDDTIGFCLTYTTKADAKAIAALPDSLFGFTFEKRKVGRGAEVSTPHGMVGPGSEPTAFNILVPGTLIASTMGGRLGPFVQNAQHVVFSLTVAHLLPPRRKQLQHPYSDVVVDSARQIVGHAVPSTEPSGDYFDESNCLALIQIDPQRTINNTYGEFGPLEDVVEPADSFGKEAFVVLPNGDIRRGIVSSNGATVSFYNHVSETTDVYVGAIRVRSTSDVPFSIEGDSGAPVVTGSGKLLGLVLSGNDDYTYVVPAAKFIAKKRLSLVQGEFVDWDNQGGRRPDHRLGARPNPDPAELIWRMASLNRSRKFGKV